MPSPLLLREMERNDLEKKNGKHTKRRYKKCRTKTEEKQITPLLRMISPFMRRGTDPGW